jgi:hypothetical protein
MSIAAIRFELPWAWWLLVPLAAILVFSIGRQHQRGVSAQRLLVLNGLRFAALLALVGLIARPVQVAKTPAATAARPVTLLVDRSESMSLEEGSGTRYQQAFDFLNARLMPALKSAHLPVQALLFDKNSESTSVDKLSAVRPSGKRTDLGGAIAEAFASTAQPPLAIVALTDGIANERDLDARALAALTETRVPFIGVGFGGDRPVRTLSLRHVDAPASVAPKTAFSISAQLEAVNADALPAFDLVLFRDGKIAQRKTAGATKGSRLWLENFQVNEDVEGVHNYIVRLVPPQEPDLRCAGTEASTSVRVTGEKKLRVLYVQGALTWDYKFINRALADDTSIKLTGLTRTSEKSVFRQNVENVGELLNGFPARLEELAPFRVIVLSNLRPADLTSAQQEMLAKFCGELGGGVLLVGGSDTFDSSWQSSRLEQLLPVVFAANAGVQGLDRPFQVQLTPEALAHPVFQIADDHPPLEAWSKLPSFSQYGRVDALKPGAQAWMFHPTDEGPRGRRILMASQRYGAGLSAVLAIQNFWRWRLSENSDPAQFDRFWRQLFRFLGDSGRQDVAIHLADQDLHPDMDVRLVLERQPSPGNASPGSGKFLVRVDDDHGHALEEQSVELGASQPIDFNFHADQPGQYTVTVADPMKSPIASRRIDVRDVDIEFQETVRNMESLRQWAAASDGLAFKAEECPDATDLVSQIKARIEEVRQGKASRRVVAVNGWMLTWVLGCLAGEWLLRKRWELA